MKRKAAATMIAAAIVLVLVALPVTYALAQEADDTFPQGGNPCAPAAGTTPIAFQIYPQEGPPGSVFVIQGKPHDPRTVGPGSDVSLSWSEVPSSNKAAAVGPDGSFTVLMQVPANLAPGSHQIMYAEASPYVQCLDYNVTSGPSAASSGPLQPVSDVLRGILTTIQNVVNHILSPAG